ncbi:hypothetical protein [Pedobacter namyangjuensis]|uniref:hypothetical protein n=1 Tax=Pedobacter namyangjuensis TaxID=600626 RepID=UPI0013B3B46D|nr:hypothetical protein [Pedobacter namyangjuensis]
MTTEKRYEILSSLPTYGPMYIPVTDNGEPFYSEGFPVRFYKTDGTEWIANFQPGWTDLKQVLEFEKTQNLLVIACGTCYIMNPNDTKPIQVFGVGFSNIFKANKDRLLLQDQTDLTIIEPDGTRWNTERISWDGLAEIKVENNLVSGLAYNPMHDADEWVEFKYNLDAKILTGGSYYSFENKKPWWKIW